MAAEDASRFKLYRQMTLPGASGSVHRSGSIQLFPWTHESAAQIFNAKWRASDQWPSMVDEYLDAFVVGYGGRLHILHTSDEKRASSIALEGTDRANLDQADTPQVAWALRSSHPFDPLVILADHRRIFVLNVRQKRVVAYIRGHGGHITSIAVHPTSPNIFATTSSDFTTRIYNLDLVQKNRRHPVWPPWDGPFHASAAHGMDGSDAEGSGFGRCIQILVGGRSGGHTWDVLGAAFHPRLPLIATCGADRHVKIWRMLSSSNDIGEDKPLFSARITTSRVLSIAWLAEDVLLMHTATTCTPARMGPDEEEASFLEEDDELKDPNHIECGTINVFRWMGLKRFFPEGEINPNSVLRGGASDYLESKSYTVLSTEQLNLPQPQEQLIEPISNISQPQMPDTHGFFLLAYPDLMAFMLLDVSKFGAETLPLYTQSTNSDLLEMTQMTKRIRLDSDSPSVSARATPFAEQLDVGNAQVHLAAIALASLDLLVVLGSNGTVSLFRKRPRP